MLDQLKMLSQLGPMMAKAKEMQSKMQEGTARLPLLKATGTAGGSLAPAGGRVALGGADGVSPIEGAAGGCDRAGRRDPCGAGAGAALLDLFQFDRGEHGDVFDLCGCGARSRGDLRGRAAEGSFAAGI